MRIKYDSKSFQQSSPFRKFGNSATAISTARAKVAEDEQGHKIYGENWPVAKYTLRKVSPLNFSGEINVSYSEKDNSWVAHGSKAKTANAGSVMLSSQ